MENKVLVAYGTKYGATAEIAARIGDVLREAGLAVDVQPASKVGSLEPYGAVVLGSAVYAGLWRKEAADFLTENEAALARLPVWFFSSGPTGEGDPVELLNGFRIPESLQPTADRIGPREIAVFHGTIDLNSLKLHERMMIKGVKAAVGDFRDWDAITAWGAKVAEALKAEEK